MLGGGGEEARAQAVVGEVWGVDGSSRDTHKGHAIAAVDMAMVAQAIFFHFGQSPRRTSRTGNRKTLRLAGITSSTSATIR
jgi:hypothetical protein